MAVDVLTVSSKGQIVLPAPIRKALSIASGDKLAAYSIGDTIMLKPVKVPIEDDFKAWLDEAQGWAASVGYEEGDAASIIKDVRKAQRARESSSTRTS